MRIQCIKSLILITTLVTLVGLSNIAATSKDPINKTSAGVALKGYDAVAYFVDGKPVKGKKDFAHEWMGAHWYFSTTANRDLFAQNPEKYAPQYGGFCAYGVSLGYTVDIDPRAWKVVNGKLYLNFNKDAQQKWEQNIPGNIKKADENWRRLRNQ